MVAKSKGKWVRRSLVERRVLLSRFEGSGLGVTAFCQPRRTNIVTTLPLDRFLAEVRRRAREPIPEQIDPLGVLFSRVAMNRYSTKGRAQLAKAAFAVIRTEGALTEADLWALGQDALGMLDAFAARRITGSYDPALLEEVGSKLHGILDLIPA